MRELKEYRIASSVGEAVEMMHKGPGKGVFIAGGTDMYLDQLECDYVVDINHAGLSDIARTPAGDLFLGAATTLQNVASNDLVLDFCGGAFSSVAGTCCGSSIRATATVGGNICKGMPSADLAPVLLALDAMCYIVDVECQESLPLTEFFVSPGTTVLEDRLLVGLSLPAVASTWRCLTHKMARSAKDIAIAQVAVALGVEDGVVKQARIALGSVAPTPVRAVLAEELITGMKISEIDNDVLTDVGVIASGECDPVDDHRASAEYRRERVNEFTKRLVARGLSLNYDDLPGPENGPENDGGVA